MAKVTISHKAALKNVERIFESTIKAEKFLTEIKDFSVLRIQAETRKGRDLKNDRPQPELSEGSVWIRENIEKGKIVLSYPEDPDFFKSSKSNLTLTGQLLDSISGKVDAKNGLITIFVSGLRKRIRYYWAKTGKEIKFKNKNDIDDNKTLAKELANRGREFLGLDSKGIQLIRKKIVDAIRREIRNRFTK